MSAYLRELIMRFWAYSAQEFRNSDQIFERTTPEVLRPPVFRWENSDLNILRDPNLTQDQCNALCNAIPDTQRHDLFGSMKSSQALAQSVFGALMVMQNAAILQGLATVDDPNVFPFQPNQQGQATIALEVGVEHLGEPYPTQMDVVFAGARRVAVECKFTETGVSPCSRTEPDVDQGHCNGNYEIQHGRATRCSYTEIDVQYWNYLPALFQVDPGVDHIPCPFVQNLQLVRNVLGVCTLPGGSVSPDGTAVLLYDNRNPAFGPGGNGEIAFQQVRAALRPEYAGKFHRCTWQALVEVLRSDPQLRWLTDQLKRKYGF